MEKQRDDLFDQKADLQKEVAEFNRMVDTLAISVKNNDVASNAKHQELKDYCESMEEAVSSLRLRLEFMQQENEYKADLIESLEEEIE